MLELLLLACGAQAPQIFAPLEKAHLPEAPAFARSVPADLDGDGDVDLVTVGTAAVGLYDNDGHAGFADASFRLPAIPTGRSR